jgi:hypothetical protein
MAKLAHTKLTRGTVVLRPDSWAPRGKMRRGRAIVLHATTKVVTLCTFQPGHKIDASNPHVGRYVARGFKAVGKVKKIPKVCTQVHTWKKAFWKQHPSLSVTALARARR